MDRFFEFVANHWLLSSLFVFLATLLVVTESRRGGRAVPPALVGALLNRDNGVIIDLRAESDFRAGHIAGSVNVPHAQLASRLAELKKYEGRPLLVVCNLGHSANDGARQLLKAGHPTVYRLAGGITAWRADNLPVVKA